MRFKFAIIGTGNVGKALGTSFLRAGHKVTYIASTAASTQEAVRIVGGESADSIADAVRDADAIVLAIPYSAVEQVATELAPVVGDKLVIDVTNPLNADSTGLATREGQSAAEYIAELLPGARVVKAFNTLFASVQENPNTHGVEIDALFATDDARAREQTADLLRTLSFRPVFVGPLARAHELESIAFMNISLQMQDQGAWRTAIKLVQPTNEG
jgi:predicted dinucleotide-binding enzyme